MLNCWIGLGKGASGLPNCIHEMGFEPQWIEGGFANSKHERVNPDLIISSSSRRHTLILEWKSGANTEADQLRRYSSVTGADLADKAFIDSSKTRTHDVVVVCKAEWKDRIKMGIDKVFPFVVLVVDESGLRRYLNDSRCQAINDEFNDLLRIDWETVPTSFVPMDRGSELWEFSVAMRKPSLSSFFLS